MIFQIEIEFVAAPSFFQMLTPVVSDRLLPSTQYTIGSLVLFLLSSFSVCLWQRNSRLVPLNFAWFSAFFVRICEKLNSLISDATGVCFSIWARETLSLLVYQFRAFNSFFVVMEWGFLLGLICSLSYLYHRPTHTTFLPKVEGNLIRWKLLNEENLSNKEIVLQQALHLMTTSFGKGSITWTWFGWFVSPIQLIQVAVVCTGSCALDMALGIGGIPKGRVVEIYGLEASVTSALKIWILFVAVLFVLWKSGFMFCDYEI